jgi:hypothetical protein
MSGQRPLDVDPPDRGMTSHTNPSHRTRIEVAFRKPIGRVARKQKQKHEKDARRHRNRSPSNGWRVSNPLVPRGLRVKPGGWLGDESGFHSSCSFDGAMRSGGGIRVTGSRMPETRSSDLGRRSILQSSSDRPRSRIQTRSYCNQNESLGAR